MNALKISLPELLSSAVRGDFQVWAERGRRDLRVHLECNLKAGLGRSQAAIKKRV